MDKEKNQKMLKKFIIILVVLIILTILLSIYNRKQEKVKVLNEYKYIIEKKTDFSSDDSKGLLPIININNSEIDDINESIIDKYYDICYRENDTFQYEYSYYEDILSLFIIITYVDDTEYGDIEYYSYNIDVKTGDVLSNDKLIDHLNIDQNKIDKAVNDRLNSYYNSDTLKSEMSYEQYIKNIQYDDNKIKYVIRDNKLYLYTNLKLTQSLVHYEGNINEMKVYDLK